MPDEKEIIDWLKKKDQLALMDLLQIMRKDQHPVIMTNEDYEFYLGCMDELRRIQRNIKELLKNVQ